MTADHRKTALYKGTQRMFFTPGTHKNAGLLYNPFKALITPRPIGWISSCDENGTANLAPYSFFNAVSELPPMVMFVSAPDARKDAKQQSDDGHAPKDSLHNIRQTGEFGVNIVSEAQRTAMVVSSEAVSAERDEFTIAGLSKKQAQTITAPLVAGAPAHLECRLHDMISLPGTDERAGCIMVIGLVTGIHIEDTIIENGKVDVEKYRPLARLGYKDYTTISDVYELESNAAQR